LKSLKMITFLLLVTVLTGYIILHIINFLNHTSLDEIDPKGKNVLRIVAANINFQNPNRTQTTKLLAELDADILIILEYTGYNIDLSIFENNGYKTILEKPINSPHGICTITKSGIEVEGLLIKIPYKSPCQMPLTTMRLKKDNHNISILGVHIPPPVPSCKFKTAPTIKEIATYVANGRLVKELGISKKDDLLILAGDFNIFWFHPAILQLKRTGLIDGYSSLHFIPGTTWSPFSWFPQCVGLDYIFCSKQFQVVNSYIIKINGSDHSCVITDISLG
jgi:hypothetical protein